MLDAINSLMLVIGSSAGQYQTFYTVLAPCPGTGNFSNVRRLVLPSRLVVHVEANQGYGVLSGASSDTSLSQNQPCIANNEMLTDRHHLICCQPTEYGVRGSLSQVGKEGAGGWCR